MYHVIIYEKNKQELKLHYHIPVILIGIFKQVLQIAKILAILIMLNNSKLFKQN